MNKEIISEKYIQIIKNVSSWEEAIKICAKPLINDGKIEKRYVDTIIKDAERLGAYFDIGKQVAMPHSRPENGVNEMCLSILKLDETVNLLNDKEHPIQIFILLGAVDSKSHLGVIALLSDFLTDDEKVDSLKKSTTTKEIYNLFNK